MLVGHSLPDLLGSPLAIYLDHNATTPLLPDVASAIDECYRQAFANPSSQHAAGRRARQVIEDARESIAELLGATHRPRP